MPTILALFQENYTKGEVLVSSYDSFKQVAERIPSKCSLSNIWHTENRLGQAFVWLLKLVKVSKKKKKIQILFWVSTFRIRILPFPDNQDNRPHPEFVPSKNVTKRFKKPLLQILYVDCVSSFWIQSL